MWKKLEYKDIRSLGVTINYKGEAKARSFSVSTFSFKGKDAYISDDNSEEFISSLIDNLWNTPKPTPGASQKLYVCKESKMPRALLRGADYKIVLDKDKADFIIIPFPREVIKRTFNLLALNDDKMLYKISVSKDYGVAAITYDIVENVKNAVCLEVGRSDLKFFYSPDLSDRKVYFVRKCETYIEILTHAAKSKYCLDTKCPFKPTTEISPENLEFLFRCKDNNVFEKAIFGSEWQKYPLTICALFDMKPDYYSPQSLRLVEDAIDYGNYCGGKKGYYNNNKIISADDWNMLQRWIMMRAGIDEEKGGMMTPEKYQDLDSDVRSLLHSMTMIKPKYITEDISYKEIVENL